MRLSCLIFLFGLSSASGWRCFGQQTNLIAFSLESAGARYGFPANNQARGLQQAEIFSNCHLPWLWAFGRFEVQSRLDLTMGCIGGHSENAFAGTIGPSLQFRWRHIPLELDFGSSPTLLSTHAWGDLNVATQCQFTSHAGIDWNMTRHLRMGYRFTHMSNAGIREPNPGVNMHMFALSAVF